MRLLIQSKPLLSLCILHIWPNFRRSLSSDNCNGSNTSWAQTVLWRQNGGNYKVNWSINLLKFKAKRHNQHASYAPVWSPCWVTSNLFQQQTILSCCLWLSLADQSCSHTGPAIHLRNLSTLFSKHINKCQGPPRLVYLQTFHFLFKDTRQPFSLDTDINNS